MTHSSISKITLYGHATCPQLPPVIGLLKTADVPYDYVNIHQDADGRQRVREINNGYESVPTLVFPDGSTLTEPSAGDLTRKLEQFGYHVPLLSRILGNAFPIFVFVMVAWSVLRIVGIL